MEEDKKKEDLGWNNTVMVEEPEIPDGIKGWSWGAFIFNWVWAIFNKTWVGLLVFVPYLGFAIPFLLGFKGREWAWLNNKWNSIEHFQKIQRRWSIAALAFIGIALLGVLAAIIIPIIHNA